MPASKYSRRHYRQFADVLRETRPEPGPHSAQRTIQWDQDARAIITLFAEDNPRFDRDRFGRAAGLID